MRSTQPPSGRWGQAPGQVVPLPFLAADDVGLVQGLRVGNPAVRAALFTRYAPDVERLVTLLIGLDLALADILREVFVQATSSIRTLRDPAALKPWLLRIATRCARRTLCNRTRRARRRFFIVDEGAARPDPLSIVLDPNGRETLRTGYAILDRIPADDRITFALRCIGGMVPSEVADACCVSLATTNRRLRRAEAHFARLAHTELPARPTVRVGLPTATSLEQFGEGVALALEATAPDRAQAIDAARRGFLGHSRIPGTHSSRSFGQRLILAGAAPVVALAAAAVFFVRRPAPITLVIKDSAGTAKSWLAAPKGAPLRLEFSEGTKIRFEAGARARLSELGAHGARLAFEGGRLHAEVVHQPNAAWRIEAGPFTVNVTGTVFDVKWEPDAQELVVSVSRGSVSVRDADTGSELAVHAQETLRAMATTRSFELWRVGASASLASDSARGAIPARVNSAALENSAEPLPAIAHDAASAALGNGWLPGGKSNPVARERP
jgi:RNA polymerase sigma-70 factor (ECF subfamily)